MAIVIAALVARGVLPQGAGSVVGSPAPEAKEDKEDKKKKEVDSKVWTEFCPAPCLYQEFFGLSLSDPTEIWPAAAGAIADSADRQHYKLEFLVALVPDPVDSHLSNLFDEALDALQRGIAESGYLFDRVSLPWEGEAAKMRLYRSIPGGLLFRRVDEKGQGHLLAVFLIGESPKGGIQKQAFYTALDFITELQKKTQQNGLRILGPSFSGSAESLRLALRQWQHDRGSGAGRFEIEMVTGSATTQGLEKKFDLAQFDKTGVNVEFARTILSDDVLKQRAFDFLRERFGWKPKDIALITEFDTSYGSSTSPTWSVGITVPFPSNLAHIRTAREKLGLDRDPSSSETSVTARKSLDLSLADDDKPIDVVPQLNELSTQANDLALASLLRGISRRRYIGILATDLQDRLFLAEQIHSFCPDAVVFTFDNHLLDAHPKVAKSMDGMLVLTSFPLYPSREKRVSRQFISEFQQGIYLAVLRLVKRPSRLEPPVVWVAAVGNGELWPIAALSPEGGPPGLNFRLRGADRAEPKWLVSALVIALLAAWILRLARPLQQAIGQSGREEEAGARGAIFLPALGAGVLWLASGVLLVFYTLPLWDSVQLPRWGVGLWYSNLVVLLLIYLGTTFVLARLLGSPRRWGGALLWIGACVLMPVLLGWAMLELWLFPEGAEFFYARAGDFSIGLSPLVSLALLGTAVYAWAVLELKRRRLILAHDLPWPLQGSPEPALADCGRNAKELWKVLLERSPRTAFWMVLAFVFLLSGLRLFGRIQPIAETRSYGKFFVIAVMFVFLLSALSFYRFFMAWSRLERVLVRLCNTWLLPVFSRSSSLLDWKPMKSFGLRMPSIKMTLVSAQQLRAIARLDLLGPDGMALAGEVGGPRGTLDDHLDRIFRAENGGDFLIEVAARRELRTCFDESARLLERVRWSSGSADPVPNDKDGKSVPREQEVEMREIETYLALRVVAHLRYVFAHLRYTLVSATICGLALLFAVSSYAFQPKQLLSFGIWMTLLLACLMTLRAFVQMDRNGALSAISGTDAGKVNLDRTFFSNLFTYGGIPVLGVVITQFPSVGQLFGSWLDPLLRIVGAG
jgi:hypothetical protein